jgi:apolipoprotein N-acyltransferase
MSISSPAPARAIDVPGLRQGGRGRSATRSSSPASRRSPHRPDFLFNPSNDAWFGSWGPPQHLAQARLRAIEEGLPILRATPTGISAIIDAHGRLLEHDAAGQEGAIEAPLPARCRRPVCPLGNWLAFALPGFCSLFAIAFGAWPARATYKESFIWHGNGPAFLPTH